MPTCLEKEMKKFDLELKIATLEEELKVTKLKLSQQTTEVHQLQAMLSTRVEQMKTLQRDNIALSGTLSEWKRKYYKENGQGLQGIDTLFDDCNELIRFLTNKGLSKIAIQFSKAMKMELIEDLSFLETEDLERADMSFLRPWHKRELMRIARDIKHDTYEIDRELLSDGAEAASEPEELEEDTWTDKDTYN